MRGRKHPLEVYQRARPFVADEEPRVRKKPPRRRGAGLHGALKGLSTRWARRIGRIPLRRVGLVGAVLVLILAGLYAVKFWPSPENGDAGGSQLRSEWRDPVDREQRETRSTYWIQVASGKIPGVGFQGHVEEEALWKRQEVSVQRQLDVRLERDLPGVLLRAKAIYSDQETQDDVRLLVGSPTWTDRKDPQIRQILDWLQQSPDFAHAFILLDPIAIPLEQN